MGAAQVSQCLAGVPCFCFCGNFGVTRKHFFVVPHESTGDASSPRDAFTRQRTGSESASSGSVAESFRKLMQGGSGSSMGKSLRKLIDDDFGGVSPSARVGNILETWDIRGATRPITDFYSIEATLGSGAYGVVQKWKIKGCEEEGMGDVFVAVKQITWKSIWGGWMRDASQEQCLRNELKMLLMLDNPFIVKFREWFEQPCSGIFFVMELCSGPSLQDVLEGMCELPKEKRQASMPRFRRYFREITYAISYIHGLDPPLVHRDIKPDNVLLKWPDDPNSVAKLIDFGLTTLQEAGCEGGEHEGTPIFMAPEQYLSASADITQEMDVWALGVIFVWIVTGLELGSLQHPMMPVDEGKDFDVKWISLYRAYRSKQPWNRELFGDQPESAFHLCDRILDYDPRKRVRAFEILEEAWVRCGDPCAAAAAELLRQGQVITNIMTYKELSRFDKKLLSLMADNVHDRQVIILRRTFQALDTSKTGKLSWSDFVDGFKSNDVEFPQEIADSLYNEVDKDGTGEIAYHDWLAATIGSKILRSHRATTAAFRCLNASGSGKLTRSELAKAVGKEEADSIMLDKDVVDETGCISYEGFKELVRRVAERRVALQQPEAIALRADIHRDTMKLRLRSSYPCIDTAEGVEGEVSKLAAVFRAKTFHPGGSPTASASTAMSGGWFWGKRPRRQLS